MGAHMLRLGVVISTLIMCQQVNNVTLEKILKSNEFNEYILMNQGASNYQFSYKPIYTSLDTKELENEQFLVVDFSNFEIKE